MRALGNFWLASSLVGGLGHGQQFVVGRAKCVAAIAFVSLVRNRVTLMDILYLLVPMSVVLVFFIIGGVWWAIYSGQFEDIEAEGERILRDD